MLIDGVVFNVDGDKIDPVTVKPRPRVEKFVPRPCTTCPALRQADDSVKNKNASYSRVKSTQGEIRHCKCDYCGATWSQTKSYTGE